MYCGFNLCLRVQKLFFLNSNIFSSFSWKVNVCIKKSKRQKTIMKFMRRLENNIRLNINETGRDVVWIQVALSRDR